MTATTERSEQPATRVSGPRPVVAILGLVGLTLATRLPGLDRPRAFVFDEIYYALDAAELLRHGVEPAAAHPPLGKWLIAAGIQVAGFTPTGWRLAALLAGIALVLVTWWAARTVTDDPWLALLGAGLVALDGIAYVTGRLALLDVFVALATTVAAGATLAALRDRADAERLRRWRWVAALALGAGVAVKWGAVWTWPVVAAVLVSLERRVAAPGGPRRRRTVAVLATLTLVPAGVYLVAYGPWLAGAERSRAGLEHCGGEQPCRLGALDRVEVWVDHQLELLEFHAELEVDNPEAAPAWSWAAQWAPSDLYRKPCRADHAPRPRPRRRRLPRRRWVDPGPAAGPGQPRRLGRRARGPGGRRRAGRRPTRRPSRRRPGPGRLPVAPVDAERPGCVLVLRRQPGAVPRLGRGGRP